MKYCLCLLILSAVSASTFQAHPQVHLNLTDDTTCTANEFDCGRDGVGRFGRCIPNSRTYICDGMNDCMNGADERNCVRAARTTARPRPTSNPDGDATCTGAEFDCGRVGAVRFGRCIPNSFICDGVNDCTDAADERNCRPTTTTTISPFRSCKAGEFRCSSTLCLKPKWVCDGYLDCTDGEDERNCPAARSTSPPPQLLVANPPETSTRTKLHLLPHYVRRTKVMAPRSAQQWQKTAPTEQACARLCDDQSECKLVSYDNNGKQCTAYGEDASDFIRFVVDEDYTTYAHVTATAFRYLGATFQGTEITYDGQPIADWLKLPWSEPRCMQACHIHPKCSLAFFDTSTNKCELMEQMRNAPPVANPDHVSIQIREPGSRFRDW